MTKPTKNDPKRPLKLSRQTLRVLDTAELALAVGGVDRQLPFRSMGCGL